MLTCGIASRSHASDSISPAFQRTEKISMPRVFGSPAVSVNIRYRKKSAAFASARVLPFPANRDGSDRVTGAGALTGTGVNGATLAAMARRVSSGMESTSHSRPPPRPARGRDCQPSRLARLSTPCCVMPSRGTSSCVVYASFIPFMPSPLKIRPGLVPCRGNVPRRLARYPPLCRFCRPYMEELGTAYTVAVAGWNKKTVYGCLRDTRPVVESQSFWYGQFAKPLTPAPCGNQKDWKYERTAGLAVTVSCERC